MDKNLLYTDLASELIKSEYTPFGGICKVSNITLNASDAERYGKGEGDYVTVETDALYLSEKAKSNRLTRALSDILKRFIPKEGDVLVIGLGNECLTADALGVRVCENIDVSGRGKILCPSVSGLTGIESFDIIKGVVDRIKPAIVIAIDSLAAASTERVGRIIQFSNAGITPGSGVSNHRTRLSEDTLGIKVISIGVPLVVHATTIIKEANGDTKGFENLIVTPKEVDAIVADSAKVLANAINEIL